MFSRNGICTLVALLVSHSLIYANEPKSVTSAAPAKGLKIDGVISPGEWEQQSSGTGFFELSSGTPSPDGGTFWIASDERFIYFAGHMQTNPAKIVKDEYRQNVPLIGNDAVILVLDTFSQGNQVERFSVNAQGASMIRLSGGRAAKTEWLGEFDAAGRVVEDGWEFEARIPWGIMPLPAPGVQDMKFNVLWQVAHSNLTYEWQPIKGDYKNFAVWRNVSVPKVNPDTSLRLLPYAYAGYSDSAKEVITDFGVDAKQTLSDQLTLVATANPDFRNIENDILSLEFSNFERLARESRPFFLEGNEYRTTQAPGPRMFASQRIADFDTGLNLYGNLDGRTQIAFLNTNEFGKRSVVSANVQSQIASVHNASIAYVGNFEDGLQNDALATNYHYLQNGYDFYASFWNSSDEVRGEGARFNTGMTYSGKNIVLVLDWDQVSPDFALRAGFVPERNLKGPASYLFWRQSQPRGSLMETRLTMETGNYEKFGGGHYRDLYDLKVGATTKSGLDLEVGTTHENFLGTDNTFSSITMEMPKRNPYRNWKAWHYSGNIEGDAYSRTGLGIRYKPTNRTQVLLSAESVRHTENQEQLVANIRHDIGKFESVGGRIVRRGDDWNWYLSYRMGGKKGNEYFVILGDPNATEFQKSLIFKVTAPLTIK